MTPIIIGVNGFSQTCLCLKVEKNVKGSIIIDLCWLKGLTSCFLQMTEGVVEEVEVGVGAGAEAGVQGEEGEVQVQEMWVMHVSVVGQINPCFSFFLSSFYSSL